MFILLRSILLQRFPTHKISYHTLISFLFSSYKYIQFPFLFHCFNCVCLHNYTEGLENKTMKQLFLWLLLAFISSTTTCVVVHGFEFEFDEEDQNFLFNLTDSISYVEEQYRVANNAPTPFYVPQTIIQGAAAKGAVCLDGSLPAYHIDRGWGSGANNWVVNLEGGGWCYNTRTCAYRKNSRHGSSLHMEKQLAFTGILSNKAHENPDFFNWNRVKIRYCDGASFTGDSYDKVARLYYRGQRIYVAAMEELMSKGMRYAKQALLSGCSAGGLSTILHCDEFRKLFPGTTKVKCLSDAGLFLDAIDVSGGRTMRKMFQGVVNLQRVKNSLPWTCTNHLDATSCFFPQNLIANIKTPMFLLNAAYDSWQFVSSLAPPAADPHSNWKECKANHALCSVSQIKYLQGFRNEMLNALKGFAASRKNGLFINSCFAHCQSERQDTWFSDNAPLLHSKGIAKSVGDWYFDRSGVKSIDCPYPCDNTCHNLVF